MTTQSMNQLERYQTDDDQRQVSFTDRFEQALVYASHLHRSQRRKLPPVPYVCHVLGVAALVIEDGGDEDEAIAALLHDAIEDQGGAATGLEIQQRFGDRVYGIVQGCTINCPDHVSWRSLQQQYIQHLIQADPSVHRVALADKLHNGRSILGNLYKTGHDTWNYFHGSADDMIWFYETLVAIFTSLKPGWMTDELRHVVQQLTAQRSAASPSLQISPFPLLPPA